MDQTVEKRAQRNFVVKNDHVQVGKGSQVHEVRKVTGAKRHSLGIKGRRRDAGAFENDRLNVIKQGGRKIISDGGSPSRTQRLTRAKIEILLLAQIGRHAGNDLGYTSLREFNGIHRSSAYTQLSRTVLLEEIGRASCRERVYVSGQ